MNSPTPHLTSDTANITTDSNITSPMNQLPRREFEGSAAEEGSES